METSTQSSPHARKSYVRDYSWHWEQKRVSLVWETQGEGDPVLLLPAFSTVSSRTEMGELARRLSSRYLTFSLDWLGFGQSDRPPLNYRPELYRQLLQDFVTETFNSPIALVAAGHAAGYALHLAAAQPQSLSKLVLVAPTWRGPLRAMGLPPGVAAGVRAAVRSPLLGQLLYFLNTTPSFLRLMYGRHVYVNRDRLTPEFIARKREITQQPGARFAPAAFVTGALDPASDRARFLSLLQACPVPILHLLAQHAPPKSKAEMTAMAELPNLQTIELPGTLGLHEEYPEAVAQAILSFLP